MTVLDISAADALAGDFSGDVITPDHPAYDDQRRIWNGEINRRPGGPRPLPGGQRRRRGAAVGA